MADAAMGYTYCRRAGWRRRRSKRVQDCDTVVWTLEDTAAGDENDASASGSGEPAAAFTQT
jgi:hypothetical protein